MGLRGRRRKRGLSLTSLRARAERSYVPAYDIALVCAGLGWKDQALELLSQAYGERSGWITYLRVDPRLDSLRSDARFVDLLRRTTRSVTSGESSVNADIHTRTSPPVRVAALPTTTRLICFLADDMGAGHSAGHSPSLFSLAHSIRRDAAGVCGFGNVISARDTRSYSRLPQACSNCTRCPR